MNRFLLSGIALTLCAFGAAQDLSRKITIDIPAARAKEVLAKLSQAAEVSLSPAANLRDEVFVIHAVDATVQEIMDKIAQAESGRWSQQGGGYILVRESATTVAQERAELKLRAAALSAAIAKLNASINKTPAFNEAAAQKLVDENKRIMDQMNNSVSNGGPAPAMRVQVDLGSTPTGRAIGKILAGLDANKLAQIAVGQRVVFSTQPTMVQHPLGSGGTRAFNAFIEEQSLYAKIANGNQPPSPDGNTRVFSINGFGTPVMGSGDPRLGLGVGLVIVQRRFGDGLSVDILAADPKMDTIASGNYFLQLEAPTAKPVSPNSEKPLQISEESKELAKALGGGSGASGGPVAVRAIAVNGNAGGNLTFTSSGGGGETAKLSPGLREKILQPEKYEPLGFAPSDAMLALAGERGKSLVALLPDTCFSSIHRQFANDVTPSQFIASFETQHGLELKEENGWMVVAPVRPYSARAAKIDRSAVGNLIRKMDKEKGIRLDDVAAFATATTKVPSYQEIDLLYPQLIDASTTNSSLAPLMYNLPMYKFYGSLSSAARQSFGSGQQIRFASLSAQQLDLVADMLYNSPQGPQVQVPQSAQSDERAISITAVQGGGRSMPPIIMAGGLSAKTERTIVVPNGVPRDGYMMGMVNQDQVAQGLNSQTGSRAFLDAGSIAFSKSSQVRGELSGFNIPEYDKYRMGSQTNFGLRFFFNPQVSMMRSLIDTSPTDAEFGSYESLPADFRKKVDDMMASLKDAFGRAPGGGRTNPPPP